MQLLHFLLLVIPALIHATFITSTEYTWLIQIRLRTLCSSNTQGMSDVAMAVLNASQKLNKKTLTLEKSEIVSYNDPKCCQKNKCNKQNFSALVAVSGTCKNSWGCKKYILDKAWQNPVTLIRRELKKKTSAVKIVGGQNSLKVWVNDWCVSTNLVNGKCLLTVSPTAAPTDYPTVSPTEYPVTSHDKEKSIGFINSSTGMFTTTSLQPLAATLPIFGEASFQKYESCKDLKSDLINAANIIVNHHIESSYQCLKESENMDNDNYYSYGYRFGCGHGIRMYEYKEYKDKSPIEPPSVKENSFETNNQVKGVKEADLVKSTQDHVFSAYGDKIIIWDVLTGMEHSVTLIHEDTKDSDSNILGLLLQDTTLGVLVETYLDSSSDSSVFGYRYKKTEFQIYDISSIPKDGSSLSKVVSYPLPGNYHSARSIETIAHIVTQSSISTYKYLDEPFNVWNEMYKGMKSDEYLSVATQHAKDNVIPKFVKLFVNEIKDTNLGHGGCKNVMKLVMFQSIENQSNDKDEEYYLPWLNSLIESFIQVTTLDMSSTTQSSTSISLFSPSSYGTNIYASSNILLISTQGYQYHHFRSRNSDWKQTTYILAFTLGSDGSSAQERGMGKVPGYILNQWSMDVWNNHARIASMTRERWGCVTTSDNNFCQWSVIGESDNQITILKLPTDQEVTQGKTTLNQVGFLDDLGEPGERIEAIRFIKDKAFLVTFLRTDPFYTIDLSSPTNPKVLGELKIPGYSSYLHPYDSSNDRLIAVGQDADSNGRVTGLQISLFDVTNLSQPKLQHRFIVENDKGVYSSSEVEYDHKAFRFLSQSKKLLLPVSIRDYSKTDNQSFDGFYIFDVSKESGISLDFEISHVDSNSYDRCWSRSYLPSRSFVHNSVVMTLKRHSVQTHELDTQDKKWDLNLDENYKGKCVMYWY